MKGSYDRRAAEKANGRKRWTVQLESIHPQSGGHPKGQLRASSIFISHSSRDNAAALELRERLEGQGHRSTFLDFDPEDGIPAGRDWERELYRQLRACRAVIALCSEHSMASRWCFAEITHAKSLGKHIFPIKVEPCEVDPVLTAQQILDLTQDRDRGYERLWRGLEVAGLDPADAFDWDPNRSPYPGLAAFQESDAGVFFGRGSQIQQGLEVLQRQRQFGGSGLLLVLGASGSGKSSLMRAGMVPRLRRDPDQWLVVGPFRPKTDPLQELAIVLAEAFSRYGEDRDWQQLSEELKQAAAARPPSGDALNDWVLKLQIAAGRREATVLLAIDQVEELLGAEEDPFAEQFLTSVRLALEAAGSPVMAIGTLRSDFLGAFQVHPSMQGLEFENSIVGSMTADQLVAAIEGPARKAGIELEPGLTEALLEDTATEDALPLLAFTLRELYDAGGDDGLLEIREYREQLGGLTGSVARAADAALAAAPLSPEEMRQLRAAFLSMVRINEEGKLVRRPARWSNLPASIHGVLERFVGARLLVSRGEEQERLLEVSHEALFRSWDRLKSWLDEDREFLLWRRRFHQALEEWHRSHDPSALLSGPALAEASGWQKRRGEILSVDEHAFIDQSARAAARRRWTLAGITAAVILALAGLAGISFYQANLAESRLDGAIGLVSEIDSAIDQELKIVAGAEETRVQLQGKTRQLLSDLLEDAEDHPDAAFQLAVNYQRAAEVAIPKNELITAEAELTAARTILERLSTDADRRPLWQSQLSEVEHRLGRIAQMRKQLPEARVWHEQGMARAQRLADGPAGDPLYLRNLARSQQMLGRLAQAEGPEQQARGWLEEARENLLTVTKTASADNEWKADLARIYHELADRGDLADPGFIERARDQLMKSLSILEDLTRQEPENATWQSDLALTYSSLGHYAQLSWTRSYGQEQGELEKAEKWFQRSLEVHQRLVQCGPRNISWRVRLGAAYDYMGGLASSREDPAQAREWYESACESYREALAIDPENRLLLDSYAMTRGSLGGVAAAMGELDEARTYFSEAVDYFEGQVRAQPENPNPLDRAQLYYQQLGALEQAAGRLQEAEEWQTETVAALRRLTAMQPEVEWHQHVLTIQLNGLGVLAIQRGEQEAARRFFEESLELGEDLYAKTPNVENASALQVTSYFLAHLLQESDPAAAQRFAQRALELDQLTGAMSGEGSAGG